MESVLNKWQKVTEYHCSSGHTANSSALLSSEIHKVQSDLSRLKMTCVVFSLSESSTIRSTKATLCTARFKIQKLYVLPTQCNSMFCVALTKTAITSLYNTNLAQCSTSDMLIIIHVSGYSPALHWFEAMSIHVRFVVEKSGTVTGVPHSTSVSRCENHSTNAPYPFSPRAHVAFTRTRRRRLGTLKKAMVFRMSRIIG
jgi:hypothetical protein